MYGRGRRRIGSTCCVPRQRYPPQKYGCLYKAPYLPLSMSRCTCASEPAFKARAPGYGRCRNSPTVSCFADCDSTAHCVTSKELAPAPKNPRDRADTESPASPGREAGGIAGRQHNPIGIQTQRDDIVDRQDGISARPPCLPAASARPALRRPGTQPAMTPCVANTTTLSSDMFSLTTVRRLNTPDHALW